jgi:3-oxoadipate enol-lactonase
VIVLVHSGICDARMWDGFEIPGAVRHEMAGFGQTPLPPEGEFSHAEDLLTTLHEPSTLIGASYGGLVCIEAAIRRPELVSDLVLLDAPLPDHDWSEEIREFWRREDELLEQGELHAAAVLNADFWLADPTHRERVADMQERAFQLESESEAEGVQPESIDLGGVAARTLVAVGELDKGDFHRIAERLAREIAGASAVVVIESAGHLPALERPAETSRLILEFLQERRI